MLVLVTGSTGFVGGAVIRALQRHGHRSLAFVRDAAKAQPLRAAGVEIAVGDMARPETYEPLVAGVDAVIHAAQQQPEGRWSRRKIAAMHASDALMTRTLARACLAQGKRLIHSSGALTHAHYHGEWIDESAAPRPCLLARGHAEMVAELTGLAQDRGLDVVTLSPGFVYGAGSFIQMTAELLRKGRYRIIGRGDNFWSLVYVEDAGEAYALALERGRAGESYFLGDATPLPRREVIDLLCDGLGLPHVGHVPRWLVGLMLGFPMVEAITSSVRVRNDKARGDLGWQPRYASFVEGLPAVLPELRTLLSGQGR